MDIITQRKAQLLGQLQALNAVRTKPDENSPSISRMEHEVYELFPKIAAGYTLNKLTQAQLIPSKEFYGYLYNKGFNHYVSVDSDNKWLYADASATSDAVMWTAKLDSVGNFVLTATVGTSVNYFNWRNITGACKFYDEYDKMKIEWSSVTADQFQFKSVAYDQYIGTWSSTDNELYVRGDSERHAFEFHYIVPNELSEEDQLLFRIYVGTGKASWH